MGKKQTIWELIKQLDEQAGEFNVNLHKANLLFDTAAKETGKVLEKHQQDLHKTITKLQKALRTFNKQKKDGPGRKKSNNK